LDFKLRAFLSNPRSSQAREFFFIQPIAGWFSMLYFLVFGMLTGSVGVLGGDSDILDQAVANALPDFVE
jgi:hypothetical protein